MPITRSTWIDDDGSGTTGTILNNAELQKIYNNIDAWFPTGGFHTEIISADTGTLTNWAPTGFTNKTHLIIYWTGATNTTINSIAAGTMGQTITIKHLGAAAVLSFAHGAAPWLNKLSNKATSAPTPLGVQGTVTYIYSSDRWHLIAHEQGDWIAQPYAAGDFTVSPSGGWTVPTPATFAYRVSGRALTVSFYVSNTTISGAPLSLNVKIPGGFSAARAGGMPFNYAMGTAGAGWATIELTAPTLIKLYRDILGSAWAASTCHISGVMTYPIG